jgi:TonB family protein
VTTDIAFTRGALARCVKYIRRIVALTCALALAMALPVTAQVAADFPMEIQFNPAAESWARVKRIVTPRYPKDALANGTGAVVDITVSVATDGTVKDVQRVEATPSDARFEGATRAVLKHWRFRIALTARCVPIETVGNVRLTFKVVDGKEEISLSHRTAPPPMLVDGSGEARPAPKLVALNFEEVQRGSRYPSEARREGAQADVWILAKVDPASGTIIETETAHVNSHPRFTEEFFLSVGAETMKALRFEPQPQLKDTVTACLPMAYRLRD